MGDFMTVGLEEVMEQFSKMDEVATRAVPQMLEVGAEILANAQRAQASEMGIKETSGFIESIKPTKVQGSDSTRYIDVYPQGRAKHGNDRKRDKSNVRYATIGFVAQYGTSSIPARPYMTIANEKARNTVNEAMFQVWKKEKNGKH